MRLHFISVLLAASLLPVPATADDVNAVKFEWRSETRNDDQLALELERLYVTLYNTGNMPTKTITDPNGATIEPILREHKQFFGAFFPAGVENVLCDLNSAICSRPRSQASSKELESPTGHIGGYAPSSCSWKNQAGSSIVIPDLQLTQYTRLSKIILKPGQDPNDVVNNFTGDCSEWGMPCQDLVRRLNPRVFNQKLQKTPINQVIVPVSGMGTNILLASKPDSKTFTQLRELGSDRLIQNYQRNADFPGTFSGDWKTTLGVTNPTDLAVKSLSRNLVTTGGAETEGATDEPLFGKEKELLELINHPFVKLAEFPPEYKNPISIAVVDTWLDQSHCDLDPASINVDVTLLSSPTPPATTAAPSCGEVKAEGTINAVSDHATHIIGLLAAPINGKGLVGLNPYAKVNYVGISTQRLKEEGDYRKAVKSSIWDATANKGSRIVNISWRYNNQIGSVDPIGNVIAGDQDNVLYVVAAGNESADLNTGCNVWPACFNDKPNVITVVGLGTELTEQGVPILWAKTDELIGSNYSKSFHIGAIAGDVMSTVSGGYVGKMSGTSQAAPQVAAAASLLHSIHEQFYKADEPVLLPIRVKNRLIYTADIHAQLFNNMQSGRLNIARALEVARDVVVLKGDAGPVTYRGNMTKFGNFPPEREAIYCRTAKEASMEILRKDLRRMYFDPGVHRYVIFKNSKSGDPYSRLDRIHDCVLLNVSHKGTINTENGTKEFEFRDIRDYVSTMYE